MEKYLQSLVEKKVIPGISLLTGQHGDIRYKNQYGYRSLLPSKEVLPQDTPALYDMASLTKPLVTAFLTVFLEEREKLNLDTAVRHFFPQLPPEFDMTLLHLLTHTSGLPAWYPFYLFNDDYLPLFSQLNLESKPGKKVEYSCVGYILLHYILGKITGMTFQTFAHREIFVPLGLNHTFLKVPDRLKTSAAPTENGNLFEKKTVEDWALKAEGRKHMDRVYKYKWRQTLIQGETHDINSYHLGGSAGNAGLFSTAEDIFRLCREFFPSTASILKPASLECFWSNFTPRKKSHRTVGFKRNSSLITSGGHSLSKESIGHNGFTGTSVWLDPKNEAVYVILANRVHPVYKSMNFDLIRRRLHRLLSKYNA